MLPSNTETVPADILSLTMNDAQNIVRDAAAATTEKADELLAQGSNMAKTASAKALDIQAAAIENGKKIAATTNDYVRSNPWKALGIAAAGAALLSAVIARR